MENNLVYSLIETFKEQTGQTDSIINESSSSYDDKIKINSIYCPYFTIEETEMLRDYYHDSNDNKRLSDYFDETAYHHFSNRPVLNKTIDKRISDLLDKLRDTNDPDEIDSIKDALHGLNYEFEEDQPNDTYYNEVFIGPTWYTNNFKSTKWHKDLERIEYSFINSDDDHIRDFYRQQLVDLGWNPELEYTPENQILAKERIERILNEHNSNLVVDITNDIINESDIDDSILEANTNSKLKPVYVCLIKGKIFISDVIKKFTKGDFSHAGLALDGDFTNIYSYNLINDSNKLGGFSRENVANYPQDNRFSVFCFFVDNEDYEVIKERIKYLSDNVKNTTYSFFNLLLFPFKHINFNSKDNMICSQFVDSCMKMINVNITGLKSAKVSPNKLYSTMNGNNKIYKVFDGITKDFNPKKIVNYINRISNKAHSIKECSLLLEGRKFPIQINDNGDVLITNPNVDLDSEYFQSHKLLLQYAKTNNLEGMKYELARLYYMNYLLEKRIYHNKHRKDKEKNIKTRARVLNDFNKYLKFVLDKEPNFNFGAYYEQSPFYPHTIEINKSTIDKLKDILNNILYKNKKK